jgi:polyhydroxybutyrate depolymerase
MRAIAAIPGSRSNRPILTPSERRLLGVLLLSCAIWVAAARPAAASCDGNPGRSGTFTIEAASAKRTFVARVPTGLDGKTPGPVMFAFHPFGMNAQYMASRVPSRFWPEAIVIYPDGLSRPGGPLSASWHNRPGDMDDRDVRFFDAMLAWLQTNHCIDPRRVFVMGYSNGAGLAYVLACERADAIAGIAIAAGRLSCAPTAPKPIIISHGTRDQTIGYEQAIESSLAWSKRNGCAAPKPGVNGCVAAASCTSAAVTLCTYAGGHEYDSSFTQALVNFFKSVPPK